MTEDIRITRRYVLTANKGLKSDLDINHLLSNGVSPEEISILCVKLVSFVHTLKESNAKLVRLFKIAFTPLLNQQDNAFPLLNNMCHPPIKRRLAL